ncbi:hypothetical protein MAHJHV45_48080 [Mycobacterium avium subsp. hominissuis]
MDSDDAALAAAGYSCHGPSRSRDDEHVRPCVVEQSDETIVTPTRYETAFTYRLS